MKKKFENTMTMTRKMPHVIRPMANSPFIVKEDAEMQRLRESIKEFGLFSPIVLEKKLTKRSHTTVNLIKVQKEKKKSLQ